MAEKVGSIFYELTLDTKGLISGEREAKRRVDSVAREFDGLQTRVTKVAAAISAAIAAIAIDGLVSKVVTAQRQFDVMFASLKTMTGGVQQASAAWERLEKFASQTPFSLEQSVRGFTKLKALGLDPSERALTSFGNTASAMGKSLEQMIEAVADASTGEFERLKEFGVKAKQEGDRVSLTFQGVTTTIGNNSREITEYLTKIGEVEFAGAMSERMKTLDGDISNLEDSLAGLYRTIAQSGVGDAIAGGVRLASEAIIELSKSIKQGELTPYFDGLSSALETVEIVAVSAAGIFAGRMVAATRAAAAAMVAKTAATRDAAAAELLSLKAAQSNAFAQAQTAAAARSAALAAAEQAAANVAAARSSVQLLTAQAEQAAMNARLVAGTAAYFEAMAVERTITAQLVAAKAAETEATAALTAAERALAAARGQAIGAAGAAAAATTTLTAAQNAQAAAAGLAARATSAASGVLAALGGPVGIAVTALILLALNWDKVGGAATDAAEMSEQAADRIASALRKPADLATKALGGQLAETLDEIKAIETELANTKFPMASEEDLSALRKRRGTLLQIAADIRKAMDGAGVQGGRGNIIPAQVSLSSLEGGTKDKPGPKGKREIGYAITDPIQEQTQRFLQSEKAAYDQIAEWEREQAQEAERNAARRVEAQRRGRILAEDTIAGGDEIDRLRLDMERRSALLQEFATIDQENAKLYADAQVALEEQTSERIRVILQKRRDEQLALQQQQLTAYGNVFGSMADLVKTFGGEQSKAYKVLFAASKAFAIASSIVSIQKAYADAWGEGSTLGQKIAAVATIASQTAGIVATIRGTNYGGGRQYGGPAAAGSLYRVNETGRPEMFTASNGAQFMLPTQGGRVTPADQVAGGGVVVQWTIITPPGMTATVDNESRMIEIAVARAEAKIAGDIGNNTGPVYRSLRGATNVQPRQG